jgi:predicted acylesterase/phospholipase RssA
VVIGERTVRQLGAGTVLGELSMLTGGRRSASVRARRDSHLLQLTHDQFQAVVGSDVVALSALTTVLAEQLAHPVAAAQTGSPAPGLVAVVALADDAPTAEVADVLAELMARHVRVVLPGRVDPDGLERAEHDHDCVVLVAQTAGDAWWDMCVRQADLVVVVARPGQSIPETAPLGRTDTDLVLVGPRESQDRLRAWASVLGPWRITQSDGQDLSASLRPVAARLTGRSVGVVMAGGGARAFAHIGILHELADAGVVVDRVAGSSQGSIIAALHASGMDAGEIEDRCYREFVRGRPFSDYTLPVTSVAKGRRTERLLRRNLGDVLIEGLPREFRCSSTDLQSRSAYAHRSGDLVDAVMSSISLPVLFPPRRDGARLLADGGILDNLPVRLLTERSEGPIVAVNIGLGGGSPRISDGPGATPATPPRVRIPALGETLLRSVFIGSGGAAEAARAAGAVVVTPSSNGVGLLEFHQLDRMVESGRAAGRALLEQAGPFLGL